MAGRIISTTIMFLLAVYAFWGDALGVGRVFNPFGVLFLILTGLVWFKWDLIRASFKSAKEESNFPIIRLGSTSIQGMMGRPRQKRHSDEPSQP
jgi:hypothetical protein